MTFYYLVAYFYCVICDFFTSWTPHAHLWSFQFYSMGQNDYFIYSSFFNFLSKNKQTNKIKNEKTYCDLNCTTQHFLCHFLRLYNRLEYAIPTWYLWNIREIFRKIYRNIYAFVYAKFLHLNAFSFVFFFFQHL